MSRKTVFTSVGGKPAALKLAWDWTLAGDDELVPIADRPEAQAVLAETDPAAAVAAWVRLQGSIASRLAPIYEVVVIASDVDPEVAALRAENERNRVDGARVFAEHLAALGALRPGLDIEQATAIAAVVMDPVPAGRLVHDAGWPLDDYVDFLDRIARASLLDR